MEYIKGIDVSRYQGNIDFAKVKFSGCDFVIIRISTAYEGCHLDSMALQNVKGAKDAGLIVAGYHYALFKDIYAAKKEAEYFKSIIKDMELAFVALDLEDNSLPGDLTDASLAFLDIVADVAQPLLYSSPSYIGQHLNSKITKYPLWLAHYGVQSPRLVLWPDWKIWQYSSTGTVPGISGKVDLNYMKADFLKKEGEEVDNLVIAYGDGDMPAATLKAYELNCGVILRECFEKNKTGNQAKAYHVVGGLEDYIPVADTATYHYTGGPGTGRIESAKAVLK